MRSALTLIALSLVFLPHAFAEPYPEGIGETFKQECVKGGGSAGVCACVFGQMQKTIPFESLKSEDFSQQKIMAITQACLADAIEKEKKAAQDAGKEVAPPPDALPQACQTLLNDVRGFCVDTRATGVLCLALLANVAAIERGDIEARPADCQQGSKAVGEARKDIDAATPPATAAGPVAWGEHCAAFLPKIPAFCADPKVPNTHKMGCEAWNQAVAQMSAVATTPGVTQSMLDRFESRCRSAAADLETLRAAFPE